MGILVLSVLSRSRCVATVIIKEDCQFFAVDPSNYYSGSSFPEFSRPKPFQIVGQSMPYGNLSGEAGLFFIGYASSPANFEMADFWAT